MVTVVSVPVLAPAPALSVQATHVPELLVAAGRQDTNKKFNQIVILLI